MFYYTRRRKNQMKMRIITLYRRVVSWKCISDYRHWIQCNGKKTTRQNRFMPEHRTFSNTHTHTQKYSLKHKLFDCFTLDPILSSLAFFPCSLFHRIFCVPFFYCFLCRVLSSNFVEHLNATKESAIIRLFFVWIWLYNLACILSSYLLLLFGLVDSVHYVQCTDIHDTLSSYQYATFWFFKSQNNKNSSSKYMFSCGMCD